MLRNYAENYCAQLASSLLAATIRMRYTSIPKHDAVNKPYLNGGMVIKEAARQSCCRCVSNTPVRLFGSNKRYIRSLLTKRYARRINWATSFKPACRWRGSTTTCYTLRVRDRRAQDASWIPGTQGVLWHLHRDTDSVVPGETVY